MSSPLALAVLVLLAGCSRLQLEGECTYTREVTTRFQCAPGGHVEQLRIEPQP